MADWQYLPKIDISLIHVADRAAVTGTICCRCGNKIALFLPLTYDGHLRLVEWQRRREVDEVDDAGEEGESVDGRLLTRGGGKDEAADRHKHDH